MTVLKFNAKQKKDSKQKDISLFRSEVRSFVVADNTLKTTNLTGLDPDEVKVSEFRLEQYLNACSPTCHG